MQTHTHLPITNDVVTESPGEASEDLGSDYITLGKSLNLFGF